jgi:hypothetical protein
MKVGHCAKNRLEWKQGEHVGGTTLSRGQRMITWLRGIVVKIEK